MCTDFGHIEALEEGSGLLILDAYNHLKSFGHVIFSLLLLKKVMHQNDVSVVVFIVPSLEGDHLVVSLIREFHFDLGLFLFLIEVCRLNVRDWGLFNNVPSLALQVLKSLR